ILIYRERPDTFAEIAAGFFVFHNFLRTTDKNPLFLLHIASSSPSTTWRNQKTGRFLCPHKCFVLFIEFPFANDGSRRCERLARAATLAIALSMSIRNPICGPHAPARI